MNRTTLIITITMVFMGLLPSCSSLVLRSGPNARKYDNPQRAFSREEVIQDLGPPTQTQNYSPAKLLAEITRASFSDHRPQPSQKHLRVSTVDKHVLRGHLEDYKAVFVTQGLATYTLGLSELLFLPLAIRDVASSRGDTHTLIMAYGADDLLVAHDLQSP